jgi:hypothetical protein
MKSKIEVRVFAVEQAVKIMGAGTPQKDVVAKAQEIEEYITQGIVLPDVPVEASPVDYLDKIASLLGSSGNAITGVAEK